MLLFCEKRLFWANLTIFVFLTSSFFCDMYCFAKFKLNYTLFQENHAFPFQNRDLEQKIESADAYVL